MTKTATLSDETLRARRDQILVKLDTTLEELCARASNYALIGEEHQAWEELESIAFLLGENRAQPLMTLTHDEFNDEVDAFVLEVANAANCLDSGWSIDVKMAEADRLRSVVDVTLPLRESSDQPEGGRVSLTV